ncbi:MAG: nucleoside-triphosphatase, partial [Myxococcota bacterium]
TGAPAVGKTTTIERAIEDLDPPPIGFITKEVRAEGDGARIGFRVVPLRMPDAARIFAHREFNSLQRVGRYGIDIESLNYGLDMALSYRGAPARVAVVDEVGKMECFSPRFEKKVRKLLDGALPVLGTVSEGGGGLMADVRGHPEVRLVELTHETRDEVLIEVQNWLAAVTQRR